MPSGKQLSFENGEVSPSLRFRTTLASYATGLSSILNYLIRKSGGASNRAGFQYVKTPTYQDEQKTPGSVRLFGFIAPAQDDYPDEAKAVILLPAENGGQAEEVGVTGASFSSAPNAAAKDLTNVKVSQTGHQIIFSNGSVYWAYKRINFAGGIIDETLDPPIRESIAGVPSFTTIQFYAAGGALMYRPVMYRVYQVFKTGEETLYAQMDTYDVSGIPINPTQEGGNSAYNVLTVPLSADDRVKHYNIYRSSRSETNANPSGWGLVGRVNPPAVSGPVEFTDFILDADLTVTPPEDYYLYGEFTPGDMFFRELVSTRLIGHYQQRRIIIPDSATSKLDEGAVIASKLGAVKQLDTQKFFSDTGAFDFTLPIGKRSRIVAMMELERLILMTEDAIIAVRGGELGELTPSTVNPHVISYVGCSKKVTPAFAGNSGFFMSRNEERLMRVRFGDNGNLAVEEMSLVSDHLLSDSLVKEMVLVNGPEDVLYILKKNGKLVSVTIHEGQEVTGWARHDTDGFIESITTLNEKRPMPMTDDQLEETFDSLYISVIRDDTRYIERLVKREDSITEQFAYMDSHMDFGARLRFEESNSQYVNFLDAEINPDTALLGGLDEFICHAGTTDPLSIGTAVRADIGTGLDPNVEANWTTDQDINVKTLDLATGIGPGLGIFSAPASDKMYIDFYYDELADPSDPDSEVITKSIRWIQNDIVSITEAVGRFTDTVPQQLRSLSTNPKVVGNERKIKQTRWSRVRNKIGGLKRLEGREVSFFADGIVIGSPNNPEYTKYTVNSNGFIEDESGSIELDEYFAWGMVGIPYESEMETLDLDTSDNRTFTDSRKLINKVGVAFHESKGGFIGQTGSEVDKNTMEEIQNRADEVLEEPTKNINEHLSFPIPGEWEQTGRIKLKQIDPLPMTILAIYPKGIVSS